MKSSAPDPAEAPADKQLEMFRRVRDEIRHRLNLFLLADEGEK